MNNSGINYLISNKILRNTGNFEIFYDFDSYVQSGNQYYINSIKSGNQSYSGEIFYYNQDINTNNVSNLILDNSRDQYITKSGKINLIGHRINETGFANSYIKILNTNNLYNNLEFTFIFEGGKTSKDEAKEIYDYSGFDKNIPIHNKEIIFSNIIGSGSNYSGWEIGLNSTNLLYFRTSDDSKEKILTYYENIPSNENIWAVSYKNKNIYISRFSPEKEEVFSNNTSLISNLKNGADWYIGSGNNNNIYVYDTGSTNGLTSSIKLRKFLYFKEYLSQNQILQISKAIKSNLELSTSTIYETGYVLSGYQEYYQVTGIIGSEPVLSGYITETITVSGNPIYTAIYTGVTICDDDGSINNVSNTGNCGDILFSTGEAIQQNIEFSINCTNYNLIYDNLNQLIYTDTSTGGNVNCQTVQVITGYSVSYNTSGYNIDVPIYINSGITGIIETGIITLYTGIPSGYIIQESKYIITGENYLNLNYRSISYLGKRNEEDFIEINSDNNVYSGDIKILNYDLEKTPSNIIDGYELIIDTGQYDKNKYKLYLNGVAIRYGSGEVSKIIENNDEKYIFNLEKDYFITGNHIVLSEIFFTGFDQISNLHAILDINEYNITPQELIIFNEEQLLSGIFDQISPSGNDIFLNGIKIYEGEQYVNIDNKFAPIGYLTEITGIYFTFPKLSGYNYYTGSAIYDIYKTGTGYFREDSAAFWINGIRKNKKEFIYHDKGTDLITGVYIYIEEGDLLAQGILQV